jgi:hypothetical protein
VSSDLHDLDDLAALWAEEPKHEERQEFAALARRVSWRAAFLHYWDIGLGVAIAVGVLFAVVLQPAPVTFAVGLVAAGGLLWSTWKRHLLKKQVMLLLEVSERTQFLDLEIRRVRTDLHRAVVGLLATPPAILLFAMLTHSVGQGGSLAGFAQAAGARLFEGPVGPVSLAAILTLLYQQSQIARRLNCELRRLKFLSGEYRQEARLDGVALG